MIFHCCVNVSIFILWPFHVKNVHRDKQIVAYTCNGMLYRYIKEWSTHTYYNIHEPQKHYVSEKHQRQKITYCMIPFIWLEFTEIGKSVETACRLVVARGWGEVEMGNSCSISMRFQSYKVNRDLCAAECRRSQECASHMKTVKMVDLMWSIPTTIKKHSKSGLWQCLHNCRLT